LATSSEVRVIEPLEVRYSRLCAEPSDINEHLPLLRALAERCKHVTEIGMRGGVSTTALLAAKPETMISWDINPLAVISQTASDLWCLSKDHTAFQPRVGDSLKVEIEETDLLFIDSFHSGKQLQQELRKHGEKARRFIALHDVELYGEVGEDGSVPGLVPVIRRWRRLEVYPLFRPALWLTNDNGMIVLQREKDAEQNGPFEWSGGTRWVGPGGRSK